MPNNEIWIAFTKSRPLEGCDIDFDGCEFYFAEAYVPVEEDSDMSVGFNGIVDAVKRSLSEKRLALADVSMLVRYRKNEWDIKSDSLNDVNELAEKAMQTNSIVFSGFRSEEIEALQSYRHSINELEEE